MASKPYTMANSNNSAPSSLSLGFIQLVKLDRTDYLLWKTKVLASIIGNGLEGFINGEKICLAQFLTESTSESNGSETQTTRSSENPDYVVWKKTGELL